MTSYIVLPPQGNRVGFNDSSALSLSDNIGYQWSERKVAKGSSSHSASRTHLKSAIKKKVQGAVVDQSAHSCNKRPDIISPRVNAYWKAVTHFVNRRVYIRGVWDVTTCNEGTIRFIFTRFYGGDYLTSAKVSFTFLSMFDIFFSVLSIRVKKYPFYRHIGHVPHK